MATKLSDRFSQLASKVDTKKKISPKVAASVLVQKGKRNAKLAANRQLPISTTSKTGKGGKNGVKGKVVLKGKRLAKGGKNGRKGGKEKKEVDLDMELDKYWHKVGKGPDPIEAKKAREQAKLDKEMDEYRAKGKAGPSAGEA